jgi:Protein of unknown function (DUF1553)/Protein of unknown function (DUF1549)/Concanavalin A-like lectin/glucanases superfamily/Planctomycete cytochrome C
MKPSRIACLCLLSAGFAAGATVEFNRDIRPILSDKCFTCHGPDAAHRQTAMRFDIESSAKAKLKSGRYAIVPGDPANSEMYRRVSSENKAVRMPPAYMGKERLSDREIASIKSWIEQGAVWEPFWSFIPPKRPAIPAVSNPLWVKNPIDAFILSRLDREKLHPAPEADRATLLRRVSLDLTGIPPTPAEVDAFVADSSPDAYEHVVDRLLASPRYGERMAFRWMEAARYGDTNGYQTDGPREMWRWRDWVIDAFNSNKPFDQFTIEQLAGDLLPKATLPQKIATGFNRNHRTNGEGGIIPEEYRVEYVADRTQTTATVWMGLTVGCARCHDHKYDPISQKNFYQMFAYFNNIPNEKGFSYNYGNEEPYIKAPLPEQQQKLDAMDHEIAAAQARFDSLEARIAKEQHRWEQKLRKKAPEPDWTVERALLFRSTDHGAIADAYRFDNSAPVEIKKSIARFGYLDPFTFSAWVRPESEKGGLFSQSEDYFEGTGHGLYILDGKLRLHIVHRWTDLAIRVETKQKLRLNEWQHVTVTYDGKRKAAGIKMYVDGQEQATNVLFDQLNEPFRVDEKVPFRIGSAGGIKFKGSIADVRVYKEALLPEEAVAIAARESVAQIAAIPAAQRTRAQTEKMRLAFLETGAPADVKTARATLETLRDGREKFYESIPTVMIMSDGDHPRDTFLLKRGAYDAPGEKVTPGVPDILPQPPADYPKNRLGLARWMTDKSNPLTARVAVNRYWQSYFGVGIVKTVDDFGSQGEWPVHPELLDWLATEFVQSGWDVKHMQKLMVMSATYRQASRVDAALLERDPENRLLARGPHVRLGPEVIRDQALFAAGLLTEKVGGPSVKPYQPPGLWQELGSGMPYVQEKGPELYRRSLYTYWRRTVAPPFMMIFDSPNREVCTVYENRTNTPLQALDLMNDVTFLEASRKVAERMMTENNGDADQRLAYGFRLLLARRPKPAEEAVLAKTLGGCEQEYRDTPGAADKFLAQGESPIRPGIDKPELAAYTAVASLMLNMDAAINKE